MYIKGDILLKEFNINVISAINKFKYFLNMYVYYGMYLIIERVKNVLQKYIYTIFVNEADV